jgi:hypothetical protein
MNILKIAHLGSLRIAFFGALLKAALFACTLFLSDRNASSGPRQTMIAAR